jgi:hypothetical protein
VERYASQAIYSGSALADVDGRGLTLIYPGVCHKEKGSPHCLYGTTVNLAQPSDPTDPLSTNFTKLKVNPIAQVNAAVGPGGGSPPGGGGDSSAPWKTVSGEWRLITRGAVNNSVWASRDFFAAGSWAEIGPQPGFTQGACPSFFPLPPVAAGAAATAVGQHGHAPAAPTHTYLYSKTTLPAPASHRSVMVVGTYVDRGAGVAADWSPARPFQIIDNGTYYAAKVSVSVP